MGANTPHNTGASHLLREKGEACHTLGFTVPQISNQSSHLRSFLGAGRGHKTHKKATRCTA